MHVRKIMMNKTSRKGQGEEETRGIIKTNKQTYRRTDAAADSRTTQ